MHSNVRRNHGRAAIGAALALAMAATPVAAQSRVVLPAGSVILVRTTTAAAVCHGADRTDLRDHRRARRSVWTSTR